ncbi:response regulator [Microvirga sp. ACRRW]|uniref:response regulator transcription factor n=1 Tax=Microvirga sp. ACRRW TaxID=2918205 RepID=UPI001EF44F4B|nr:response regulator [Microvirga sp. ACRRW]MCG7393205.1 response regulator [Microvirga sp. ACRRW]
MPTPMGPVLVVDDDDAVRQSLKFALEQEGFEVRLYGDGTQLLADGALPPSGCLVVDLTMPGMDGIALMDRLRERHVALPAILITTSAPPHLRELAMRAGFRLVLEKPLEDGALLEGITSVISR